MLLLWHEAMVERSWLVDGRRATGNLLEPRLLSFCAMRTGENWISNMSHSKKKWKKPLVSHCLPPFYFCKPRESKNAEKWTSGLRLVKESGLKRPPSKSYFLLGSFSTPVGCTSPILGLTHSRKQEIAHSSSRELFNCFVAQTVPGSQHNNSQEWKQKGCFLV